MYSNRAAFIKEKGARIVVESAPFPTMMEDEIIVRTHAVGLNPAEVVQQSTGLLVDSWPHISGCDVAGEVVKVIFLPKLYF
jgi:NADPH:quinone reductase-like Zn-dependent oxidoreductase